MSARLKLAIAAAKGLVPRLVFGNCAGVANNIGAARELSRLQRRFVPDDGTAGHAASGDQAAADAAFLSDHGYLVRKEPFRRALMDNIQRQYLDAIDHPTRSVAPPTPMPTYRHVIDPLRNVPDLRFLITDNIRHMLVRHYGCNFGIRHVRCWRTYHVPDVEMEQDLYSNTWHTDQFPVTSLRLFVYLSDGVTRETGAFQFQPEAETREIMRSPGYLSRALIYGRARELVQDPARVKYFEGGLGSSCFCNVQLCLHRAGVPRAGTFRDVAQFYIEPADRPLSASWPDEIGPDHAVM